MTMAAASTIFLLLLCCYTISSEASQEGCDYYGATGDNFTVPLAARLTDGGSLQWIHNEAVILNKKPNNVFITGGRELVNEDGSLRLMNLKKSNAGTYKPKVYGSNGKQKGNFKSIRLCVMERVPKPSVDIKCKLPSVTFTCKAAKDVTIEWLKKDKVLEKEKSLTLTRDAQLVQTDSFTCNVSNRVSFMTSNPATQNCFKSGFVFPETLLGINSWIVVGVGGGVVLVLIIVVIICCVCAKRKKSMQLKDEGELRLAWTNEQHHHHHHPNEQQHHHHQHPNEQNPPPDHHHHHQHHHQQQPAGHTGPRPHRSKQSRNQPRPPPSEGHPQPSPRRPTQAPGPVDKNDDEQPPPLPQPRKKAARIQKV